MPRDDEEEVPKPAVTARLLDDQRVSYGPGHSREEVAIQAVVAMLDRLESIDRSLKTLMETNARIDTTLTNNIAFDLNQIYRAVGT